MRVYEAVVVQEDAYRDATSLPIELIDEVMLDSGLGSGASRVCLGGSVRHLRICDVADKIDLVLPREMIRAAARPKDKTPGGENAGEDDNHRSPFRPASRDEAFPYGVPT